MTKPAEIRADEVRFYLDDVYLPGHIGIYRAAEHDRADKADHTLFVSTKGRHVYFKDDTVVRKRTPETLKTTR